MRTAIIALSSLLVTSSFSQAMEISGRGNSVYFSGDIKSGDDIKLKEFLVGKPSGSVTAIWLNSSGGWYNAGIAPARELGRIIRANGMTTVVDAARSKCESACTIIFASGVRRIYLNAAGIAEKEGESERGLGFWEGFAKNIHGQRITAIGDSAQMIDGYYEFGVGGAVALMQKAGYTKTYHISLKTALESGVATGSSFK